MLEIGKQMVETLNNGIIISTKTPASSGAFPMRGVTAWALNQVTQYPAIHMHQDGLARSTEAQALKTIGNGSTVYITGHGQKAVPELSGMYAHIDEITQALAAFSQLNDGNRDETKETEEVSLMPYA